MKEDSFNDEPLTNIKKLGADFVINNQKEDTKKKVMEISAGKGVDFVLDSTGNADLVAGSVQVLSSGGKIAPYALYPAGVSLENIIDRNKLISTGPSEELAHRYLLDLARWKYIPLDAFYSHRLPFNRIEEGFELLKAKKASKVVVEMEA